MNVTQNKTKNKATAEFNVVIPATDIQSEIDTKLQQYGADASVPGFRKGKTPMPVLKKRYGQAVYSDVVNAKIQHAVEHTAKQNTLRVAMQPNVNITSADMDGDLAFDISYVLIPDFKVMDISKMALSTIKIKVDDTEVDAYLERLAKQARDSEVVDKQAENGDVAVIDFVGTVDGVAFDGGTGNDHPLELGSNTFIPGFEDQLIGCKAGDKKDVVVTFPQDYQAPDLAGKESVFACTVKDVKVFKETVIDDALAKKFGLEDLKALKSGVRDQFSNQFANETRSLVKRQIMDILNENHTFDVPPAMLDLEFNDIWSQVQKAKQANQLDASDAEKSDAELKQEYTDLANRRVRLGLVLSQIASEWNIQVEQDDVNTAIMQEAKRHSGQEAQIFEYYQKNPQIVEQLKAPILEEKVVDAILEKADVTEDLKTAEDIQAMLQDMEDETGTPKKRVAKKSGTKKSTPKKASTKKASSKKASAKKSRAKKS